MAFINEGARRSLAALASATSANGTARNGTAQATNQMQPGTLSASCSATIVTGSVVATFKWQVSADDSTWVDLKPMNNAAAVTVNATGSVVLDCPASAMGWRFVRAVATLSGAVTAAGDLTSVTTRWLAFNELD